MRRDDYTLFFERHKPVTNTLEPNAPMDGAMFETYGPQEDKVKATPVENVFTILDCEGNLYAAPGKHWVNRYGYFIVEIPWTKKNEDRVYKL